MEIIQDKKNNLLHRQEIVATIKQKSIPSKAEVVKMIAEQFKADDTNIIIEKIGSKFGSKKFEISAKIYENAKSREKYETKTRKQRKEQAKPPQEDAQPEKEPKQNKEEIEEDTRPEKEPTEKPKPETNKLEEE